MSRAAPIRGASPLLLGFLFIILAVGASRPMNLLVVLNKSDHEAALVEPETGRVTGRLPTGRGPHEVAVAPDGRTAYVSNYGQFGIFREGEPPRREPGNTITVIDLDRRAVHGTFNLGEFRMPHGLRVSRDGALLWATCEDAGAVVEVSTRTGRVAKSWKTGQVTSHMLVATPDERRLYVANIGSGSVTMIERATGAVRTIATGAGAEGIAISPDGREVWVANRAADSIAVIDVAADRVTARFASGGAMPIRVRFTPDGKEAWVSNARSNTVTVFEAASRRLLATVEVGAVPVGIEISPDGALAYIACTNDDRVKVVDVERRTVVKSFTTGNEPDGMAWAVLTRLRLNSEAKP